MRSPGWGASRARGSARAIRTRRSTGSPRPPPERGRRTGPWRGPPRPGCRLRRRCAPAAGRAPRPSNPRRTRAPATPRARGRTAARASRFVFGSGARPRPSGAGCRRSDAPIARAYRARDTIGRDGRSRAPRAPPPRVRRVDRPVGVGGAWVARRGSPAVRRHPAGTGRFGRSRLSAAPPESGLRAAPRSPATTSGRTAGPG